MRLSLALLAAVLAAPGARAQTFLQPAASGAVEVDETQARAWAVTQPRLAEDVDGFEAYILSKMRSRGVKVSHLSPESLARLRAILTKTSQDAPAEFHFFSRSAGGLTEAEVTGVFISLQGDQPEFSRFVRSRIRFVPRSAAPEASKEDKARAALVAQAYETVEKRMQVPWDELRKAEERIAKALGGGGGFDGGKKSQGREAPSVSATGGFHPVGPAD